MERSSHHIITLYSPIHEGHHPPNEYLHGHLVPFFEMPQRLHNIHAALTESNMVEWREPSLEITKDILAQTVSADMLDYLEYTSTHVADVIRADFDVYKMGDTLNGDEYYYESVLPDRMAQFLRSDDAVEHRPTYIFDSVSPIGARTWEAVLASANLAYVGAGLLLDGAKEVYALCRPPGHHAGYDYMGGYCYINNAGVAANHLKGRGKVAILDIDYHHGNGTQALFWDDTEVLFVSIHGEPPAEYPHYTGFAAEKGGENAPNTTLNFPLPLGTTDEAVYLAALDQALDAIRDFDPAVLVVSLGFDAFKLDPISDFKLEIASYMRIGRRIAALGLPTLYIQEGGYHLESLGDMAVSFFRGVLYT